jgi:hypothetical protein
MSEAMKDSRVEERKRGFKVGKLVCNLLEDLGSISKKREEFANRLRKNKKQEFLLKRRLKSTKESFTLTEESIKRLSECDPIFTNPEVPLVFFNSHP